MQSILRWSSLTAVVVTAFLFLRDRTIGSGNEWVSNLDSILLFGGIVLAMLYTRRTGSLSFRQGLTIGFGTSLVVATVSRLYVFCQLRFVDDSLFDSLRDRWVDRLQRQGATPVDIQNFTESFNPTPLSFAAWNGLAMLLAGVVFSTIMAAFLRRRR